MYLQLLQMMLIKILVALVSVFAVEGAYMIAGRTAALTSGTRLFSQSSRPIIPVHAFQSYYSILM